MCKIISVCNQKGGTGKSASAVNLGIGLARAGQRVLVLDNDPQGSLTASLGFDDPDSMDYISPYLYFAQYKRYGFL